MAVGLWLQKMGYDPACKGCGFPMESQKHCFWDCTLAQSVWKRVLRIVAYVFTQCTLSWGMAMWSTLQPMVLSYELESIDKVICLTRGTLSLVPMQQIVDVGYVKEIQPLWEILSSTTMWYIWKARCALVLDNRATNSVVSVREIWLHIVLTLRGQFDAIQGDSDRRIIQRLAFIKRWKKYPFFMVTNGTPEWCYRPPSWIFPPPMF